MASLQYDFTLPTWYTGSFVYIAYEATYDPITNSTTVTFARSHHRIFGQDGYNHKSHTTVTVTATDSGENASTSMSFEERTNGGQKIYYGAFSPISVTVKHSNTAGEKSVEIAGDSRVDLFYNNGTAHSAAGSGSTTVATGTFETFALSIITGDGASVEVNRTQSPVAETGVLADGSAIYKGDVLQISYSASLEYEVTSATVNGTPIKSGVNLTVTGNVAVVIATDLASIVHVGDKIGILYVYMNGAWRVGLLYAGLAGRWHIGIGYIFFVSEDSGGEDDSGGGEVPEGVAVTYDVEGNVYLSGVTVSHDGAGNVVISGVTATDDGNGNIKNT